MASAALMRMVFEEFCKLNKNLILESNFRQAELEALQEIAQTHGYQVLTVVLRADVELLHKRFLHRLHHENRHPVHASGGFEEFENFSAYVLGQRELDIPGQRIEVDAQDFDYQQDPQLLEQLDGFLTALV